MDKRYYAERKNRKGVFQMKLLVCSDKTGYLIEQVISMCEVKVLESGILTREKAWTIAGKWADYYAKLGRDVRVVDVSER